MAQCANCKVDFDPVSEIPSFAFFPESILPVEEQVAHIILKYCPNCRRHNRQIFRNERNLYRRQCDCSGENIVSTFSPNKSFIVYSQHAWWGDDWSALNYGIEYNPDISFFAQLEQLNHRVPKMSVTNMKSENCEFNNNLNLSKDCYLSFGSLSCERAFYTSASHHVRDSADVWWSGDIELSAYITCSALLYDCFETQNSNNGSNLIFCRDMTNSSYCFGCCGLDRAEYCIFNVQYSRREYFENIKAFSKGSHRQLSKLRLQVENFFQTVPRPPAYQLQCENCTGDLIYFSKNCSNCFVAVRGENCRYIFESGSGTLLQDIDFTYNSNAVFQSISGFQLNNCAFTVSCSHCAGSAYLIDCIHTNDSLGCVGTRNVQYCILNKQYRKDDYLQLARKIVEELIFRGEFGEFFPANLSPYGYNETDAVINFPLTQSEARAKGYFWEDYQRPKPDSNSIVKAAILPDHISEVEDSITEKFIECEASGRYFRISKAELDLYRRFEIPLPRRTPEQRYLDTLQWRNLSTLVKRHCDHCHNEMLSSISLDRPAVVYCMACFMDYSRKLKPTI